MKYSMLFIYFLSQFFLLQCHAQKNPIELGKIQWHRNLQKAQAEATSKKKPILILFQEVPGCGTCKNYGTNVLSHPLLKEAIETYFIPLCIYNNEKGTDQEALTYFKEPSWNNPVVRIVNHELKDIVTRINGDYTAYGLISGIIATMQKNKLKIPEYLLLLEKEYKAKALGTETATVGMYCFWSGEKTYGKLDGVISTKAGFMGKSEVVEITYSPNQISLTDLITEGKKSNCADRIFSNDATIKNIETKPLSKFTADKESKYYLYNTDYKTIPMTSLQASKANLLLAEGKSIDHIFSPRQIEFFNKAKLTKNIVNRIDNDIVGFDF